MIKFFMRDGELSHTKLLTLLSFPVSTYVIILYASRGTLTAELLGVYAGAYVLGAIGSSATNAYQKRATYQNNRNIKVDNPDD